MIGEKVRWYEKEGVFTLEEKFERVMDAEECRTLAYKKMFYYDNEERARELRELWVQKGENRSSASLGSPWGFYVGMDEIRRYYLDKHAADRKAQLDAYKAADGGFTGGLNTGVSLCRVLDTPVIYIAEDGRTAQASFFMAGEETLGKPDGSAEAYHIYGRVGADFIKEDGQWKIWHWAEVYDNVPPVGEPANTLPLFPKTEDIPFRAEFVTGHPTIEMTTHYPCTLSADGWPVFPCAHKTYNLDNSYAPEGHPALRDDCVDVSWRGREAMAEIWGR